MVYPNFYDLCDSKMLDTPRKKTSLLGVFGYVLFEIIHMLISQKCFLIIFFIS